MSAPTSLRALALTLVLLGLTAASASAAVTFAPPVEYPAGGGDVQSMGVADFDGDGTPDVAIANEYAGIGGTDPGAYSILLGNADGTLDAPLTADLGEIFNSEMGVGDFNHDDRPDLVAGDSATDSVAATLNTGEGTFGTAVSSPFTGTGAEGMAVGDFDEDGEPDVAVGHSDDDAIHLLTGNGDGTFAEGTGHAFSFDSDVYALAAGDFDGDGHLDLAVGDDYDGTVTALFGNGDGSFQEGEEIPLVPASCGCDIVDSIAAGDLDGDGKDDIVAGSNYDGRLMVLVSQGAARDFTAIRKNIGAHPSKLAIGDISGDGVPDLVMIDVDPYGTDPGNLVWMAGDGTGDLGAERGEDLSDFPATLALADVDDDGKLDAIAADEAGTVSVALNASAPTAAPSPASLTFAEQALSTVSAKQTVTVTNSDTQALRVSAVTPTGADADDLLVSETCTAKPIAPGASCTIGVRLIPSATGARSATIAIANDGGGAALEVPVTGTGGALPAGPAGTDGTSGQDGADGQDGTNGTDGTDGQDGAQGETGAKGDAGAAGPAGPTGATGAAGPIGPIGPIGPQGTTGATIERLMVVLAGSRYTVRAGKRKVVAFGATLPGTATLTITKAKAKRASATVRRTLPRSGASSLTVPALKRGTYTLKLTYTARGTASAPVTAKYTVVRA